MRNPKAIKFSNFPQSTRQDDQLSQRIWMEEMNTFMDRTLKKQQPRRWKTEDREKTYTERNEIEISNNESRSQIAFKRNSTIPRIGLAFPRQPIPQAPEGDEVNKPADPCRDHALSLAQGCRLSHSAGACLPHGGLQRRS